jgi:hypothetical protein
MRMAPTRWQHSMSSRLRCMWYGVCFFFSMRSCSRERSLKRCEESPCASNSLSRLFAHSSSKHLYVCMYIYHIYIYIYIYMIYIYTHTYTYTYIPVRLDKETVTERIYICIYIYIHKYTYIHTHTYIHIPVRLDNEAVAERRKHSRSLLLA